jgi:hypothetical protein
MRDTLFFLSLSIENNLGDKILDEHMGVRVLGNRDNAALYDGTTGIAFGPIYKGHSNAKRELSNFLKWLPKRADRYSEKELSTLMIAYKVERDWLDKSDWSKEIEKAEKIL